jgi:hypothetical protein
MNGEGGNIPIYVMLHLGFEDEYQLYKTCGKNSRLKGAEVVAKLVPLPDGETTV